MKLFKTKFRVREAVMGDGTCNFFPEVKELFRWKAMMTGRDNDIVVHNTSLEGANDFLAKFHDRTRKNTVVETKKHKFDIVFHKLKNE